MRILAIETATIEVGVAVSDETGPLATVTARPGRRQAETLHPAIADACRIARITPAGLDAVAVDIGPGLFTGLRVGVAAAKAIAGALGLPVVTATSLEVLRAACPPSPGVVIPVIDMRRGEVAWLMPGATPSEVRVGTPAELAGELEALVASAGSVLLVGDGALRHRELLGARAGAGVRRARAGRACGSLAGRAGVRGDAARPGSRSGRGAAFLRPGGGRPHQLELA